MDEDFSFLNLTIVILLLISNAQRISIANFQGTLQNYHAGMSAAEQRRRAASCSRRRRRTQRDRRRWRFSLKEETETQWVAEEEKEKRVGHVLCETRRGKGTRIPRPYPRPWRVGSGSRNFIPGGYGSRSGSKCHYGLGLRENKKEEREETWRMEDERDGRWNKKFSVEGSFSFQILLHPLSLLSGGGGRSKSRGQWSVCVRVFPFPLAHWPEFTSTSIASSFWFVSSGGRRPEVLHAANLFLPLSPTPGVSPSDASFFFELGQTWVVDPGTAFRVFLSTSTSTNSTSSKNSPAQKSNLEPLLPTSPPGCYFLLFPRDSNSLVSLTNEDFGSAPSDPVSPGLALQSTLS
ncbi:hypothetical protein M9H77_34661 [Catharanthus roseus]|uniref:Uncharacterized protein n=1 Tax=Catharanthus roseus TaxID=4058 RepID=A0ACB9ZPB6_CATRO|nr:hypothetical protein M9H77_34661 [Catharanthus roseus]